MALVVATSIAGARKAMEGARQGGSSRGLVPTMGALHQGHRKLIQVARRECDWLAVSIFVNPAQFGPEEDFDTYPRDLDSDLAMCRELGVDLVFQPGRDEVYPATHRTFVEVETVTSHLCGRFRPGHFRGVATIVLKLLNILEPDRAYFGEKDAQQTMVVRQLAKDLNLPVNVRQVPTVRDTDGLAISSRNRHLGSQERKAATALFRTLRQIRTMVLQGARDAGQIRRSGLRLLSREPLVQVEYLDLVDPETMQPVSEVHGPVRAAAAIHVGGVRLIDNLLCEDGDR
jgi:pantoate--beta-alanine ligase